MPRVMLTDEAVERLEALGEAPNRTETDRALSDAFNVVMLHCEPRVRDAYEAAVRRIQGEGKLEAVLTPDES